MNFVLIHCLAKLIFGYGSFAVHLVLLQIQQQEKDCNWTLISDKKKEQNTTNIMDNTENKQSEAGHKGLSQRKSYNSMVEPTTTGDLLQSIKMGRQGSKSSTMTASSQQTESSTLSKESTEDDQISGQPKNFGIIIPGIYRSSYPQEADYPYLEKLGLKTIM